MCFYWSQFIKTFFLVYCTRDNAHRRPTVCFSHGSCEYEIHPVHRFSVLRGSVCTVQRWRVRIPYFNISIDVVEKFDIILIKKLDFYICFQPWINHNHNFVDFFYTSEILDLHDAILFKILFQWHKQVSCIAFGEPVHNNVGYKGGSWRPRHC